ncbi:hypothetical protein SAMN05421782_12114, partial [Listeria ivanovii]
KRKTLSLNSYKMKLTAVFFVSTSVVYPVEIKVEAIKMTLASKTTKEIMDTARIRHKGKFGALVSKWSNPSVSSRGRKTI